MFPQSLCMFNGCVRESSLFSCVRICVSIQWTRLLIRSVLGGGVGVSHPFRVSQIFKPLHLHSQYLLWIFFRIECANGFRSTQPLLRARFFLSKIQITFFRDEKKTDFRLRYMFWYEKSRKRYTCLTKWIGHRIWKR